MASNILLAHAYLALAALTPASTVSGHVHPAHVARAPQPARHVAHGMPLAVTRSSARVRAGRASDGRVTLSLV
jgi:hypothetical protein